MEKINKASSVFSCPACNQGLRRRYEIKCGPWCGTPSGSLVTEKRARKRKGGRVELRLCSLDKRILRFAGRFCEFYSTVLPPPGSPLSLSFSAIVAQCAVHEEPGNLVNDVLKISNNVFFLLYGPPVLANFLNDKFRT